MKFYDVDFETNITVVTAQEYMDEVDATEDDVVHDWGMKYDYYVRAMISGGDYAQRLFAPIREDYGNSLRNAISEVMNELLLDYYAHKYAKLMKERNNR